jgi:acetyl esterase/lipase
MMASTFEFAPKHGLMLDLYVPEGPARAVVLYLHGGGFLKGSRTEPETLRLAARLLPDGIAVASADYRLRVGLAAFPQETADAIEAAQARSASLGLTLARRLYGPAMVAAVQDAAAAVACLQGLLPSLPVIVCGVSAGGIAGLSIAYPPKGMDLARPDAVMAISAAMVQPWRLTEGGPPCILLHGPRDRIIGLENARLAARRAKAVGAELRLVETAVKGHVSQVSVFFEKHDAKGQPYFDLLRGLVSRAIDAKIRAKAS